MTTERVRVADTYDLSAYPAPRAAPPRGPGDGVLWRFARDLLTGTAWLVTGTRVERVDEGGGYLLRSQEPVIMAANHRSHADGGLVLYSVPRGDRARWQVVSTTAMFRVWGHWPGRVKRARSWILLGILTHGFEALWVGNEIRGHVAIDALTSALSAGRSIIIFPGADQYHDDELADFQWGVAIAAKQTGAPILPVRIDGSARSLPDARGLRTRARVRLAFRPPLWVASDDDIDDVLARVVQALRP